MAFVYKWIEGDDNFNEYCLKRFNEKPYICEHCGHVGNARIRKTYKQKDDGYYYIFYLLYMESDSGKVYDINELELMPYEQIRADRTAILKR